MLTAWSLSLHRYGATVAVTLGSGVDPEVVMSVDGTRGRLDVASSPAAPEATHAPPSRRGLDDPRAVDILTTEHWSLLSTRTLGYQEMFGRTTIFIAILSGTVVALAFLAQATGFGRTTLLAAALLLSVALFIGVATFIRSVAINYEDALWVAGMARLREAYLTIVPELEPFLVVRGRGAENQSLGHGAPQNAANLARSLTTTSGVVAALNSVLVGALASDLSALAGGSLLLDLVLGAGLSLSSAVLHVQHAARFRRRHAPTQKR